MFCSERKTKGTSQDWNQSGGEEGAFFTGEVSQPKNPQKSPKYNATNAIDSGDSGVFDMRWIEEGYVSTSMLQKTLAFEHHERTILSTFVNAHRHTHTCTRNR